MKDGLTPFDESFILKALMDNVADSIYIKDRRYRILWMSRKMASSLGYNDPEPLLGKTDLELFGEEFGEKTKSDDQHVMETGLPIIGMVESRTLPDGSVNWTSTSKIPIRDENRKVIGLLGITREINDIKENEQELQYLATHDILTDLPNRYLFIDRLEQAILRCARNLTIFAVLYIDLDDYKAINDKMGHNIGDLVLKITADRLRENVRDSDTVGRMGGDEFAVILNNISKPEDALLVAEALRNEIKKEINLEKGTTSTTASIGISVYPQDGQVVRSLINTADQAMYQAKKYHDRCVFFSSLKTPG